MTNKDEVAELRADLAAVKRQLAGTDMPSEADVARYRSELHAARERHMDRAAYFSPEDLRAMATAAPDDVCQSIVADNRGGVTPRGVIPSSGPSNVHGGPPRGTGWVREAPLGPPPGVAHADRLMDAQDRRDRHDLMMAEAKRLAAQKATEPK